MTFNEFVKEYKLKNQATSNTKIYEVLKKIELESKVGIYLRAGNFSTNYGILNLHPSEGTHWVCYTKDCYFYSYGCAPPQKHLNYKKTKRGECIYSEYQFRKIIVFMEVIAYI